MMQSVRRCRSRHASEELTLTDRLRLMTIMSVMMTMMMQLARVGSAR